MKTKEKINNNSLPELTWQKSLPMEVFTEMESDGWYCPSIGFNVQLVKDIPNTMQEFRFAVTQTEVKPYLPETRELSELALVVETATMMQKWAKQIQSHLNKQNEL